MLGGMRAFVLSVQCNGGQYSMLKGCVRVRSRMRFGSHNQQISQPQAPKLHHKPDVSACTWYLLHTEHAGKELTSCLFLAQQRSPIPYYHNIPRRCTAGKRARPRWAGAGGLWLSAPYFIHVVQTTLAPRYFGYIYGYLSPRYN